MPDEARMFRPGDVVRVQDNLHANVTQGIGIVEHGERPYGLIGVRWTRPAYASVVNYSAERLDLLNRSRR